MARWSLAIALVAVAVALAAQAAAQPGVERSHARLSLLTRSPLTVRGTGFHRRERVRVVVRSAGGRLTRRARANRSGRFSVSFAGDPPPRCSPLYVTATGRRGSHATLASTKLPECTPR
jgi:hypothetical protein